MAASGNEAVKIAQLKDALDSLPIAEGKTYTLTKSGSTITLQCSDGTSSSVTDSNTTYGLATASSSGLMSASQYTKLNNLPTSFSAPEFVALYNSSSGTTSATLSQSIANFRLVLVILQDSSSRQFVTATYNNRSSSGGTLVGTRAVYNSSVKGVYITSTLVSLSGTRATLSSTGQGYLDDSNSCTATSSSDLKIRSVIGIDW